MRINKKQLALGALLIGTMAACSQGGNGVANKDDSTLVLSGKIENAGEGGLFVLEQVQQNKLVPFDTLQLQDDGTFSERVYVAEPGFYRLNLANQKFVNLVLDDENVMVNADLAQSGDMPVVEGSADTDLMMRINEIVREAQQETVALEKEYVQARSEGNSARMKELEGEYKELEARRAEKVKEAIRNAESSVAAIYGTNYLSKENDFAFLDSLSMRLKRDMPSSTYVNDFVEGIENMRATVVGEIAPEIALPNPEGEVKKLSDLRGNVVLVDFWAAWCGPCRRENPNVVRMYDKFKDQGFEIYGVSLDRKKEDWVEAIAKDNLSWTQVSDLNYFNSEAAKTYSINAIPATVLLDREGRIIARNLRGEALEEKLEEVFNEQN